MGLVLVLPFVNHKIKEDLEDFRRLLEEEDDEEF